MKIVDEQCPRSLDGIIGQDKIIAVLKRWLKNMDFPDSIHVGPSGVGKSTAIKGFLSAYLGGWDVWSWSQGQHPDLLILNASDERGIQVVRDRVNEFSNALPATDVPYRIIWFEEGDKITPDAQDALRNIVEDAAPTCRFFYSGNNEKFTSALFSRAAVFRYDPLPSAVCADHVKEVGAKYDINMNKDIALLIAKHYHGDLRRMMNDQLEKLRGIDHEVTKDDLDFHGSLSDHAMKIYGDLLSDGTPEEKYQKARLNYMKLDVNHKVNPIKLLAELQELLGPIAFEAAKAFSDAIHRITLSKQEKQIHVGYVLAVLAKCLP